MYGTRWGLEISRGTLSKVYDCHLVPKSRRLYPPSAPDYLLLILSQPDLEPLCVLFLLLAASSPPPWLDKSVA